MLSYIEEIIKLAMFSPAMQRLAATNRSAHTKGIFNTSLPTTLGGTGQVYSGGIRTDSMMPKAPTMTPPKILK